MNKSGLKWLFDVDVFSLVDEFDDYDEDFNFTRPRMIDQDTTFEDELIQSVLGYTQENRDLIDSPIFYQARRDWPLPMPKGQMDWRVVADSTSQTYMWFIELAGKSTVHCPKRKNPVYHVSFEPYRRLGFPIWDTERMVAYGFIDPVPESMDHSGYVAWRSVLTVDGIAEVERLNR